MTLGSGKNLTAEIGEGAERRKEKREKGPVLNGPFASRYWIPATDYFGGGRRPRQDLCG